VVSLAQLAQERDALEWCQQLADREMTSAYCDWIRRYTGREPGSAVPVRPPSPQETPPPPTTASASCGCPSGDRQLHQLARKVIAEQLGLATPGCWKCAEVGRQCPTCEAVARQNRYPENYR
jgi:hypothetical protein